MLRHRFLFCALLLLCLDADPVTAEASEATATTTAVFAFEEVDLPERLVPAPPPTGSEVAVEEAVQRALLGNAGIKAARARVDAARGEYRRRSAANNPTLSLGGTLVPEPDPDERAESQFPDTDETYLSYTFPTSGSRKFGRRAGQARLDEAIATLRTSELDLIQQVKLAYVDLQVTQESLRIQEDAYRIATTFTGLARQQVTAGAVPETNVVRSQVEEARAEQDLLKIHGERQIREASLALLLGDPARTRYVASEPIDDRSVASSMEQLLAQAGASRPELASLNAEVRALRAEVDLARSQRRPDLTVQAQFTDELTNTGNPPYKASIQLPLWDRGKIAGEVDRIRGERQAADWNLLQARRQVDLDVVRAWSSFEAAQRVRSVFSTQVFPRTRTLLERARVGYLAGTGTLLDVLDAQRVYRQAALDGVSASGEVARSVAALERAAAGSVERVGAPRVQPAASSAPRDSLSTKRQSRKASP